MTHLIECPCGAVLRGDSLDDAVAQAQTHARDVHDMALTADQAAAMARPE